MLSLCAPFLQLVNVDRVNDTSTWTGINKVKKRYVYCSAQTMYPSSIVIVFVGQVRPGPFIDYIFRPKRFVLFGFRVSHGKHKVGVVVKIFKKLLLLL